MEYNKDSISKNKSKKIIVMIEFLLFTVIIYLLSMLLSCLFSLLKWYFCGILCPFRLLSSHFRGWEVRLFFPISCVSMGSHVKEAESYWVSSGKSFEISIKWNISSGITLYISAAPFFCWEYKCIVYTFRVYCVTMKKSQEHHSDVEIYLYEQGIENLFKE